MELTCISEGEFMPVIHGVGNNGDPMIFVHCFESGVAINMKKACNFKNRTLFNSIDRFHTWHVDVPWVVPWVIPSVLFCDIM